MSNEDTPEKEDSIPAQWPREKTGKPGTEKTNDNGEKTVIPTVR